MCVEHVVGLTTTPMLSRTVKDQTIFPNVPLQYVIAFRTYWRALRFQLGITNIDMTLYFPRNAP